MCSSSLLRGQGLEWSDCWLKVFEGVFVVEGGVVKPSILTTSALRVSFGSAGIEGLDSVLESSCRPRQPVVRIHFRILTSIELLSRPSSAKNEKNHDDPQDARCPGLGLNLLPLAYKLSADCFACYFVLLLH